MPTARALLVALLALAALAGQGAAQDQAPAADAPGRALFENNCASCHGLDGSGQGSAVLDRPARSFKDGGFSFGNTVEAISRTIVSGIPGSPMAGFGTSFSDEQLSDLAGYVRSLGPAETVVDESAAIMVVRDRPLFVRGILPPVVDGAPLRPRGLLVGGTDGLSFEYRIDDLRLLAVRQGEFVRRTDWSGRGGTPLAPLGKIVHLFEGGDPAPMFWEHGSDGDPSFPYETRLNASRDSGLEPSGWSLEARVFTPDGEPFMAVTESAAALVVEHGAGFVRHVRLMPQPCLMRLPLPRKVAAMQGERPELGYASDVPQSWWQSTDDAGLVTLHGVVGPRFGSKPAQAHAVLDFGDAYHLALTPFVGERWVTFDLILLTMSQR